MANEAYRSWYGTQRWRKLAKAHLAGEPLCRMCLKADVVTAASVCDHVHPHRGEERHFWAGPFQSLCTSCHSRTKQASEMGRGPQQLDADGWPA